MERLGDGLPTAHSYCEQVEPRRTPDQRRAAKRSQLPMA
jgi:hypothetical protein